MSKSQEGELLTVWAVLQIPWSQAERKSWLHQTRVFLSKHLFTSAVANLWCIKQWKQSFPSLYMYLPAACNISTLWDHTQTHTRARALAQAHSQTPSIGALLLHSFILLLNWLMLHDSVRPETPPWWRQMHICPNGWLCMLGIKTQKSRADPEMLNWGLLSVSL